MDALLRAFLADEGGATAIEYGLIAGLVAVAAIGAFNSFHEAVDNLHTTSADAMTDVASDAFK
jgi:pilus assembly protein Flp/PilA